MLPPGMVAQALGWHTGSIIITPSLRLLVLLLGNLPVNVGLRGPVHVVLSHLRKMAFTVVPGKLEGRGVRRSRTSSLTGWPQDSDSARDSDPGSSG